MKLVQISTATCAPCQKAKAFIEENFKNINYDYQDLMSDNPSQEAMELAQLLQVRSVPHFIVLSTDGKILDETSGFDRNFILNYVHNFKENNGVINTDDIEDIEFEEE